MTGASLSRVLSVLLPDMEAADQKEKCDRLLFGMVKGEKRLEQFIQLSENELSEEIAAAVRKGLKALPPGMQRQHLLMLFQMIYESVGCKIDSEVTMHLSDLSGDLLEQEAAGLLRQLGAVGFGKIAKKFLGLQEEMDDDYFDAMEGGFAESEKLKAVVAAVYVACKQKDEYNAAEEFVGEYIGFGVDWMAKVRQAVFGHAYSSAHNLMAVGTSAAGIYLFDQFMLSDELEKVLWTFGKKNYMEKLIGVGAASLAAFICGSADDLFYIQPFFMESIDHGEKAVNAVKEHYQKLWRNVSVNAARMSDNFSESQ